MEKQYTDFSDPTAISTRITAKLTSRLDRLATEWKQNASPTASLMTHLGDLHAKKSSIYWLECIALFFSYADPNVLKELTSGMGDGNVKDLESSVKDILKHASEMATAAEFPATQLKLFREKKFCDMDRRRPAVGLELLRLLTADGTDKAEKRSASSRKKGEKKAQPSVVLKAFLPLFVVPGEDTSNKRTFLHFLYSANHCILFYLSFLEFLSYHILQVYFQIISTRIKWFWTVCD